MDSSSSTSAYMKTAPPSEGEPVPVWYTGDAFVDFAYDLLQYTIPKYGYRWTQPSYHERKSKKVFMESFGDAVVFLRERHSEEFLNKLTKYFETKKEIIDYVKEFCERTFEGKTPLMEFTFYCSFLLDIGLFCLQYNYPDLICTIADETFEVFDKYVKPYFTIVGGWHALYLAADQYVRKISSNL